MRQVACIVLAILFALAAPAAATGSADPGPTAIDIGVHVHENGDATWNVTATYPLNSTSDRRAFSRLSDEFTRGGPVFVQPHAFESAATTASERTNRSMSITDVRRGVAVRNGTGRNATGVLTLKFRWNNFANATKGNITVGDAFANGLLGDLTPKETLYLVPPDGYRLSSVSSSEQVRRGVIYWEGPYSFSHGGPHVEFTKASENAIPIGLFGGIAAVVAAAALLIGAAATYAVVRRGDSTFLPGGGEGDGGEPDADGGSEQPAAGGAEPGPEPESATDGSSAEELLSDEERVERLLEENGGRMKQAKIVEETRWSNAKVSQLLSAMAEAGRVEKLRIGRENLISLPEEAEGSVDTDEE